MATKTPGPRPPPPRRPAKTKTASKTTASKTTPTGTERVTFKDAAEKVMRAGDGPMKVKAIAEQAIPLVSPAPTGKTPPRRSART